MATLISNITYLLALAIFSLLCPLPFLSDGTSQFVVLGVTALELAAGVNQDKASGADYKREATHNSGKSKPAKENSDDEITNIYNVDSSHSWFLDVLAFGSCSRQGVENPTIWRPISRKKPSAWIWTGDSIYPDCPKRNCLRLGYKQLLSNPNYREFLGKIDRKHRKETDELFLTSDDQQNDISSTSSSRVDCTLNKSDECNEQTTDVSLKFIDGTWDDHDYGSNDGGKYFKHKGESQAEFLEFLTDQKRMIQQSRPISLPQGRRERKGVYSSHIFGTSSTNGYGMVKLILLDTRYHRDSHYVPSIGTLVDNCIGAIAAAFVRWSSAFIGVGSKYDGDILGDEQWKWLESQLAYNGDNVSPSVHIIVSSIQVLTNFAAVESWGHFPRARERLFALLKKTRPRGLLLVSGDVHYGEILGESTIRKFNSNDDNSTGDLSSAVVNESLKNEPNLDFKNNEDAETNDFVDGPNKKATNESPGLVEITSSGLTHSVSDKPFNSQVMGGMLVNSISSLFRDTKISLSHGVYTGKNFGILEFDYGKRFKGTSDGVASDDTTEGDSSTAPDASLSSTGYKTQSSTFNESAISPFIGVRAAIYDVNGSRRLSCHQTFNYNTNSDTRHFYLSSILGTIPPLIALRSKWSIVGRGCGFGLLAFWAAQIIVISMVLTVRRVIQVVYKDKNKGDYRGDKANSSKGSGDFSLNGVIGEQLPVIASTIPSSVKCDSPVSGNAKDANDGDDIDVGPQAKGNLRNRKLKHVVGAGTTVKKDK